MPVPEGLVSFFEKRQNRGSDEGTMALQTTENEVAEFE